jgi:hypothetical protein
MQNLRLYGIFYIGLNEDSFYWEILVMNGRKIILIMASTFFSASKSTIKVRSRLLIFVGLHWDSRDLYPEALFAL